MLGRFAVLVDYLDALEEFPHGVVYLVAEFVADAHMVLILVVR